MELTAELGYMDVGGTGEFKRLGILDDAGVRDNALQLVKRVTRLAKFSLANYKDLVPAGKPLALRFQRWDTNTSTNVTLQYGDSTNKGRNNFV